jgi:hypothetical protein
MVLNFTLKTLDLNLVFKLGVKTIIIGNVMINEGRVATYAYLASNLSNREENPG